MISAIIVDDESHVVTDIRKKIALLFESTVDIVGEANGVNDGVALLEKYEPDLLFLDVHMKDGTGFDLIAKSTFKNFNVIFITGFEKHAIKAIRVGALDYIIKPVDIDELKEAVDKAIADHGKEPYLDKLVEIAGEYFKGPKNKRVILKTMDSVHAVYEKDIIYCKSEGNYTTFHMVQGESIMISKPMKKVEEILSDDVFVRCHQSYIINKQHVSTYNRKGLLILHTDSKVPVSTARKEYTLKKIFG